MKKSPISIRFLTGAALSFLITGVASAAAVPHTFKSGDTISANDMNENFTAIGNAVDSNSLSQGPAGTYAGQVGLGELGNFSLLTGAGGATGIAAANAACAAAYPGSGAELDMLKLWNAAVNGKLPAPEPAFAYWASTVTPIPLPGSNGAVPRTSDCENWTTNGSDFSASGGFVRPQVSGSRIDVQLSTQSCVADNMAVACFTRP